MESDYTWTRINGTKIRITEMNNFHLLAAIKKTEKESLAPTNCFHKIYFNMVALAYSRGLGITDFQIRAFIAQVVP